MTKDLMEGELDVLPESGKTPFYPALDGLRTIAFVLVMALHYERAKAPLGWMGVQLFFVLSGFLITGILFDTRHAKRRFRNFYARRALRIFPLYYGFLAVALIVLLVTHGPLYHYYLLWPVYLQNFFLLLDPNNTDVLLTGGGKPFAVIGHLWSLAVEEQFYLVWPLLVFAIKDRRRLMQLCCLLICGRLGLAVYWQHHLSTTVLQTGVIYRMLPTQADGLLLGGLLALWFRGRRSGVPIPMTGILAAVALLLFAALLFSLRGQTAPCNGDCYNYRSGFEATMGLPLSNLVSAFLILAATQDGTWVYRLGRLRPMRSLGKISYGLYVYHLPVLVVMAGVVRVAGKLLGMPGDRPVLSAILSALATCVIAYASFFWWEQPFLLLKNRFTYLREKHPARDSLSRDHSL